MIIRLYSDLHLEFGKYKIVKQQHDSQATLVLAGDISSGCGARSFIEDCCKRFKYVIYIPGNHEYYGHEYNTINERWNAIADTIDNLYYANNKTVELDNVRFLCTTLWTDIDNANPLTMLNANADFSDYNSIRYNEERTSPSRKSDNGRSLRCEDTYRMHTEAVSYLKSELDQPYKGKTVVITHHSPSQRFVTEEFKSNALTPLFHANCDDMFYDYDIDFWLYGHTHLAISTTVNKTKVYSNPRGYVSYHGNEHTGVDHEFFFSVFD